MIVFACVSAVVWLLGAALIWWYTSGGRAPQRDRVLYATTWPLLLAALVVMSLWRKKDGDDV